jgi:cell wall-associated NlpC family hydrolase
LEVTMQLLDFRLVPGVLSTRLERSIRFGCVLVCLAIMCVGLSGCGAHRPTAAISPQTPIAAKKVLESAYSQVGARYKAGGNAPGKGFDCSGFVQWAYSQQGITVPRVTTEQAHAGRLVAPQEGLQPADILVFKNRQGPRGLHTGLYTGDGQFIHSPSAGQRVRTESLNVAYWKNTLIGARRLIN